MGIAFIVGAAALAVGAVIVGLYLPAQARDDERRDATGPDGDPTPVGATPARRSPPHRRTTHGDRDGATDGDGRRAPDEHAGTVVGGDGASGPGARRATSRSTPTAPADGR